MGPTYHIEYQYDLCMDVPLEIRKGIWDYLKKFILKEWLLPVYITETYNPNPKSVGHSLQESAVDFTYTWGKNGIDEITKHPALYLNSIHLIALLLIVPELDILVTILKEKFKVNFQLAVITENTCFHVQICSSISNIGTRRPFTGNVLSSCYDIPGQVTESILGSIDEQLKGRFH